LTPLAGPGRAWAALAVLLALLAAAGWSVQREAIDWQPALAFEQPWRAFSAIGVHYSVRHLLANLGGVAAIGVLGVAAGAPLRAAWAWAAAWPLTQFGLRLEPTLLHYGGLSGVLHAGVAVVAITLLWPPGASIPRWVGIALLGGLVLKVMLEAPWGAPLRYPGGIDIAVAPLAHASGLVAGLLCAIVGQLVARAAKNRRREGPPA